MARIIFVFVTLLCVGLSAASTGDKANSTEHSHDQGKAIACTDANSNSTCPSGCTCMEKVCANSTVFKDTNDTHKAHDACPAPEEAVCFPAGATVTLRGGAAVRMDALRVGDVVLAAPGVYTEVLMFTHALKSGEYSGRFVELATEAGAKLRLTHGHHIEASGKLMRADAVAVGDLLRLADGKLSAVVAIEAVRDHGLYNPQTAHGNVVVDGVMASTYTEAVPPPAAHALLAPIRMLFASARTVGMQLSGVVQSALV